MAAFHSLATTAVVMVILVLNAEGQVVIIQKEIFDLDEDVDFLFNETVNQDERIFQLETKTEGIEEQVEDKF